MKLASILFFSCTLVGCVEFIFLPQQINLGWKKNPVRYVDWNAGHGRHSKMLDVFDESSFKILDKHGYALDKNNVYYRGRLLPNAVPDSFVVLNKYHARDQNNAYYQARIIQGVELDSFEIISNYDSRDRKDIFDQGYAKNLCDVDTYVDLGDEWYADRMCAFRKGRKIIGADVATFQVINYFYAKDKNYVYSGVTSKRVDGADPISFELRLPCVICAQDKNGCYKGSEQISCSE